MTVYADVLVIVNLYIDFFLLWCTAKFLHLRTAGRRLVLGALIGALLALLSLLPLPDFLTFPLSVFCALCTAAGAFCPIRQKMFWKAALSFWMFSFLLAGAFLFLIRFFAPGNMAVLGNALYLDLSPLLLFLFTCGAYGVLWLFRKLFPPETTSLRYCSITVEHGGKRASLFAKADTGSALREPFSGLPVIVCEAEAVKDLAPAGALSFPEPPAGEAASSLRLVPFESMGGSGILPAFRPEKVFLEKTDIPLDCYLAVCRRKLSAGQFNALYNPDLFPTEFS